MRCSPARSIFISLIMACIRAFMASLMFLPAAPKDFAAAMKKGFALR